MELAKISKSELQLFSDYNTAITNFIKRIESSKSPMDKALIKFLKQAKNNKAIFLWSLDQLEYLSENAKELKSRNLMIGGGSPRKMFLSVFLIILIGFFMSGMNLSQRIEQEGTRPRPLFLQTPEGIIAEGLIGAFKDSPAIVYYQEREKRVLEPLDYISKTQKQDVGLAEFNHMKKEIRTALENIEPKNFSPYTGVLTRDDFIGIMPASLKDIDYNKISEFTSYLKRVHTLGYPSSRAERISNNIKTALIQKNIKDLLKSIDKFLKTDTTNTSISTSIIDLKKALTDYNLGAKMIKNLTWTDLKAHIEETLTSNKPEKNLKLSDSINTIVKSVWTNPITTTTSAVVNVTKEGTEFVNAGSGLALSVAVGAAIIGGLKLLNKSMSKGDSALERTARETTRELAIEKRRGVLTPMTKDMLRALLANYGVTTTIAWKKEVLVDRIIKYEQANNLIPRTTI